MKRKVAITCSLLIALVIVKAQQTDDSKVPAVVKAGFLKQFPGLSAKWEREAGRYEASFKQNGNNMSALFDINGTVTETEMEIPVSALPVKALAYFKENYKGKMIREATKITKADGTLNYEAAMSGKDVILNAAGKFLKEVKD